MKTPNLRRAAASFQHALEGVLDAYRSQRHMRVHFVFMAINAILALVYKLNALEVALLTVTISLVVITEMINTVVEAVLNLVCDVYHPIARFAKDVAAGAVLIAAGNSIIVGVCLYGNPERLGRLKHVWVSRDYLDASADLRAVAMSLVLLGVLIIALKVGRPQGSVLYGGPVSGHTAFAFCFATQVYLVVQNTHYAWLATAMAVMVAVMVAQLRLHDHTHRVRTVLYGAGLGILVPLLVFSLLARPS
jgi:diacylglycerol kinase (ATP)